MQRGKLGRLISPHFPLYAARAPVVAAALARLGSPPSASADRFTAVKGWRMWANDAHGCCVESDTAAKVLLLSTVAGSPVVATDDDVLKLYAAFGFDPARPAETDLGTSEVAMGEYLVSTGFLGFKADACVPIDYTDLDAIRWAVEWFGSCRLGVNLPVSAGLQFEAEQPWTVATDGTATQIEGRHDIRALNYRDEWFDCFTWAGVVAVHQDWMRAYLEESHAELFYDWIQKNGASPGGFTIDALASDLNSLPKEANA